MKSTRRITKCSSLRNLMGIALVMLLLAPAPARDRLVKLDERPALPGEWGYRPAAGSVSKVNPPSFSWRPQKGMAWEVECISHMPGGPPMFCVDNIEFNVYCPPRALPSGSYTWKYRGTDSKGQYTNWSEPRAFTVAADAATMPMPTRDDLLARIPTGHPRLFMRPENLDRLRESARGKMKSEYNALVRDCEKLLSRPPSTKEPRKYPAGIVRGSDPWRSIWWGNRTYTIRALNAAATLAFTRLLGGQEKYGLEAKRILLECAKWDPRGSTGYRYNDEAGMPYNYYFSRTYTFVNDLLSDQERELCRKVMKVRGDEMYRHLCPGHLWRPYGSHANRAWHFLGEIGIAFLGEVEGADDWVWFAMNVFYNTYPVWCDDDGGWHEGSSYWSSYQNRFTWWADVMREAMGVDAYDKPFYSKAGYYAMYLMPPGKVGGGFGDLTAKRSARSNVPLVSDFAVQAQNGHWQWYVEQLGGPAKADGYIGFIRGQLPKVQAVPPNDLPASRLFAGTGQALLNTNLTDAENSVQVAFKSSPFGTQSHGYEANNSFLLWAYGKRLLIRSGYRDSYGSDHHKKWMWSTRSVNNITVNGRGQGRRTAKARGEITAFKTTPEIDIVIGEAGLAYETPLKRFTRAIIFVKPELMIVYDRLEAREPSTYEYWLHAVNEFDIGSGNGVTVRSGDVGCDIKFYTPNKLTFEQTNQYDPNPRQRIRLREWHLTARTTRKRRSMDFITVYRPYRIADGFNGQAGYDIVDDGYLFRAGWPGGQLTALLPKDDATKTRDIIKVKLERSGQDARILEVGPRNLN